MIARLTGKIVDKFTNQLVLDVNGVGYLVNTTFDTATNTQVSLSISTIVRENDISLYGFVNSKDHGLFQRLLKVDGVGPKSALLLTGLGSEVFERAIKEKDPNLIKVSGIGPKTAQKILAHLLQNPLEVKSISAQDDKYKEVYSSLMNLGYEKSEIISAIDTLENKESLTSDQLIVVILKQLGAR